MASLSVRYGGNNLKNLHQSSIQTSPPNQNNQSRSLTFSNRSSTHCPRFSIAATNYRLHHLEPSREQENITNESEKKPIGHDKIDEWMRESVKEIVKNLREAPLLVQVFSENNGSSTKLKTDKAIVNDWPIIKQKWNNGESPSPEGVILVEELKETDTEGGTDSFASSRHEVEEIEKSRAWGIVIQGKGVEIGPVCYLLKTSRVNSGLGLFCTHFCLIRVHSFRESAESLLTNCWLLQ